MSNREKAKSTLVYYFRLLAQSSDIRWDSDNDAEIGLIIDCIFDEIEKKENKDE